MNSIISTDTFHVKISSHLSYVDTVVLFLFMINRKSMNLQIEIKGAYGRKTNTITINLKFIKTHFIDSICFLTVWKKFSW